MTEDQAKLTQCCGPEGCGRFNDNPYPARWCVASACMGWRLRCSYEAGEFRAHGAPAPGPEWVGTPASGGIYWRLPAAADGFCGLAGGMDHG